MTDTSQQHASPNGEQLDEIAAKITAYQQHAPTGFACCTAHPVADAGAALLAEVHRLRTELADQKAETEKLIRWRREDETAMKRMRGTIERLRTELGREERLHGSTIAERDRASDAADRLAYAVASEEVIGEHTADNCPWGNAAELLPAWEAMYEPGNVSDYLIGYANSEAAAKGAAEAWLRSQKDEVGRLEWVPQSPLDGYDQQYELVQRHTDGVDTGPGITVRHRTPAPAAAVVSAEATR